MAISKDFGNSSFRDFLKNLYAIQLYERVHENLISILNLNVRSNISNTLILTSIIVSNTQHNLFRELYLYSRSRKFVQLKNLIQLQSYANFRHINALIM